MHFERLRLGRGAAAVLLGVRPRLLQDSHADSRDLALCITRQHR
eukprot:SAG31_NODE_3268_length_4478_cov_2.701987_6_plen_44_part_00